MSLVTNENPKLEHLSTGVASVMLKQISDYQPIIRTWFGANAVVNLTRPEIFEVRTIRVFTCETLEII
jgi:hypothetical protein